MTRTCASLLVIAAIAFAAPARADSACPRAGTPWLRVNADAKTAIADRVVAQLRLELEPRGVDVCAGGESSEAPLADVTMRLDGDALALRVEDRATDKHLERTVSLRGMPNDARPLAAAVAIDELVRASWLEAVMTHKEEAPAPPPPPPIVIAIAKETLASPPRTAEAPAATREGGRGALDVMFAGEHAFGGTTWGGFDARVAYGGRLAVGARLGYRLGVISGADHGDIESSALLGGLSLAYAFTARESAWSASVFARGDAARVAFVGRAAAGARGGSDAAIAWMAGGGLSAGWSFAPTWRIGAELSLAAPLRSVSALDNGKEIVALSGAIVGAAIGIGAAL